MDEEPFGLTTRLAGEVSADANLSYAGRVFGLPLAASASGW
jgi:hypothetical protein